MGRRFSSDKKTATTIALRLSTLELLNALSTRRNVSRSELVEHALRVFLTQAQEKEVGDEVAVR
jgi:metal-responsive CopG/Arc/MetJ family transcriptional regulator